MIICIGIDSTYASTEGCGCCADSIDIKNIDRLKSHLMENIEIALDVCELAGIDFNELLSEATQKK
jgi:hypothetical protein